MDGEIGVSLSDGTDEPEREKEERQGEVSSRSTRSFDLERDNSHGSGSGLEKTSHIFDTENVDSLLHELVDEVEVVLEGVLRLLGVGEITRVADGSFDDSSSLLGGVDTELHVLDVVERA